MSVSKKTCYEYFGKPIKDDIIETLGNEQPLTVTALAKRVNLCWRTTKKRLLELITEEKVVSRKVGGITLFSLNHEFEKEKREP